MIDFKAAIFDLDGTLIDSMGVWGKIDYDFLAKRDIKVPRSYINDISAHSFREAAEYTIRLFHLNDKVEDIIAEWNDMALHEYTNNIPLKPYVMEYLTELKNRGVKLVTATSLPHKLSEPVMKNSGIYDLFDIFCSSDEVGRGKEFCDIFLLASQKLQLSPGSCIVFEDILPAVKSAKQAGMFVYGVYDRYSKEQWDEIKKTADGFILDFSSAPKPEA